MHIVIRRLVVAGVVGLLASACGLPFGLGQATTAQLLNGAADNIANAKSFEMTGSFTESSNNYTMDIQYQASGPSVHMDVTQGAIHVELLQVNGKVYYKGADAVSSYTTSDEFGKAEAKLIGNNWFTTSAATPIDLSDITNANKVKANFLTGASYDRKDNVQFNGQDTAELTDSDSIINITESQPYDLVRIRTKPGKTISGGMSDGDLALKNYNKDFGLGAPTLAYDLDDPTTLPPYYVVGSVNINGCDADPCVISAVVVNKGGTKTPTGASVLTFTLTSKADNSALGNCKVNITPDISHGASTTKGCSITSPAWSAFSGTYLYNATVDNPSYD
jgi:hypothetical protein